MVLHLSVHGEKGVCLPSIQPGGLNPRGGGLGDPPPPELGKRAAHILYW